MKAGLDNITFESQAEIGYIINALEEWKKEHSHEREAQHEVVKDLINKLDVIGMSW